MTERERFAKTLRREKIGGRVPHFELSFALTMEALGKVHPAERCFFAWDQMRSIEQKLHIEDMAKCYVERAKKYNHSALLLGPSKGYMFNHCMPEVEEAKYWSRIINAIRENGGDDLFIMFHGDPTFPIPDGNDMIDFSVRIAEDKDNLKIEAQKRVDANVAFISELKKLTDLDGVGLCCDYCFNTNPFYSPALFEELIAPYLEKVLHEYRGMGLLTIKHTDGNVMPILDQIVQCKPDAVHSIDPQAGVDLQEVMDKYGDKVAIAGNVNCGLLSTGTQEEIIADTRRSLKQGMSKGGGYIFCTSNCVHTGMPLENYELINGIWGKEAYYPE